jgi:hypothetical protein
VNKKLHALADHLSGLGISARARGCPQDYA